MKRAQNSQTMRRLLKTIEAEKEVVKVSMVVPSFSDNIYSISQIELFRLHRNMTLNGVALNGKKSKNCND
ncbi:CLUMA_CG011275, isoform A [Clunio marinus]|uniref:CLUMA_CG011275, isoform A n=1 Tax=Clunio marinus TaxID=568069 RepID=A0A1J1IEB9_9DIPT|nr:CLUMA_CG011275, isoform A [Clunio marinus]